MTDKEMKALFDQERHDRDTSAVSVKQALESSPEPRLHFQYGLGRHHYSLPTIKRPGNFKETRSRSAFGTKLEYTIAGKQFLIVASLPHYDVCRAPDRTYVCIERKNERVLGPYPLPD